ncbi:MAG TPA: hypothetical protein VFR18_11335 [Terriglobia bacterium]|nr:hypothetical protein [Terriglobia bacterium]
MAAQSTAAFGIFSDRITTENAIDMLRAAGFRSTDIFALYPDDIPTSRVSPQSRRRVVRGVAAGGGAGLVIGALLEWLVGAGMLTVGGIASLVSIGTAGGFLGAWAAGKAADYERRYEGRVRRGDILISVQCEGLHWSKKAKEILRRAGGDDVSCTTTAPANPGYAPVRFAARPVTERVVAAPLRLVIDRKAERSDNGMKVSSQRPAPDVRAKSAAS